MNDRPLEAVVFDLDNTLVDSFATMIAISRDVLSAAGHPVPGDNHFHLAFRRGARLDRVYQDWLRCETEVANTLLAEYRRLFLESYSGASPLLPGVHDTLTVLQRLGVPMAVATSKGRPQAVAVVEAVGLAPFFGAVITHDDVAAGKPAPDMLIAAAAALTTRPDRLLMVGDATLDILMGKAAGSATCAVLGGATGQDEVLAARPDILIDTMDEILRHLGIVPVSGK